MPGIGLHMEHRLQQRLEQRVVQLALHPGDMVEPFRTDGEEIQVSQYEILQELLRVIREGEYFDTNHFALEINRTIFGNPLEARMGNFARDLANVVQFYQSDETTAQRVLTALGKQKEEADKKDIPGRIISAWERISRCQHFKSEPQHQRILSLIEHLNEHEADAASGIDIIGKASELPNQQPLIDTSYDKIKAFAAEDARIIPFAQHILIPVFRSIQPDEILSTAEAAALYKDVVEPIYLLDRDLRIPGTIDKISTAVHERGLRQLLQSKLPVPLQVALDAIKPDTETYNKVVALCSDAEFKQGRELKRKIYRGFAAVEEIENAPKVLEHITRNVTDSTGLASILSALTLVSHEADFKYNTELQGEKEIQRNLRLQLVDKSVKRLGFSDDTLETYVARLQTDERFERIGKILTTLAGYKHYQNPQQLSLLREIAEAELDNRFNTWRYTHDKAEEQLKMLGEHTDEWKKNSKTTRIVGELQALQAHVESIKNVLPKIMETYAEHYKDAFRKEIAQELEKTIAQNEERLRNENLPNKERKELGFETLTLREHYSYVELLTGLNELNTENYAAVLAKADAICKRKSKNPLYENAIWTRETLDQPVYRDARKITIYETDDLETLLRFGESPVAHCQNWKVDSTLNKSLLSFVADANKKVVHIANGNEKPIAMSLMRLVDWDEIPTLVLENVYDKEWSEDYGIALMGSIADKAMAMHEETGKEVRIATNHGRILKAMERFSEKYNVEVLDGHVNIDPAASKNAYEYWDCGPGLEASARRVSFSVKYISFGGEKGY